MAQSGRHPKELASCVSEPLVVVASVRPEAGLNMEHWHVTVIPSVIFASGFSILQLLL